MRNLILLVLLSALVLPAQTVTEQAEESVAEDKQEARVEEAKGLVLEREKLERKLEEIEDRLKALDSGAEARKANACSNCLTFSTTYAAVSPVW